VAAELRAVRDPQPRGGSKKKMQLGARSMDLFIQKNRLGPTPTVPLTYMAAASVFEERQP
jgi:replicative DNA helicase